jgi:hypothetical protein
MGRKVRIDRGDLPIANGYIAHGIEAVLGIDHVPALQGQVVLCFLCGSERNKTRGG